MVAEILAGAAMTFGAWGVVLQWDKRKNGGESAPEAEPLPEAQTHTVVIPGLEELPQRIEQGQTRAMESLMRRLEQPQIAWKEEVERTGADADARMDRLEEILTQQPHEIIQQFPAPAWPPELAALLTHITDRLESGLEQLQHASAPPQLATSLERIAERMEAAAQSIPANRIELASRVGDEVGELLSSVRSRIAKLPPPPPSAGRSGGDPPPRRNAPALPRVPPSGTPLITPQIPAPYVGGTVWAPAGQVSNLLELIQQQLQPNCPGSAAEFRIAADAANADSVLVGAASALGGPLTVDNYAYELTAASPPRVYRSTYPGNSTPIGELQVLAASASALHVEVQA